MGVRAAGLHEDTAMQSGGTTFQSEKEGLSRRGRKSLRREWAGAAATAAWKREREEEDGEEEEEEEEGR